MSALAIGQRAQAGEGQIGTIAWIGTLPFAAGSWIGLALDSPVGKNDGSVKDIRYFECQGDKYGLFVKPTNIQVLEDGGSPPGGASNRNTPVPTKRGSGEQKAVTRKPSIGGLGGTSGLGRRTSSVLSPTPRSGAAGGISRLMQPSPTKQTGRMSVGGSSGTNTPRTITPVTRTPSVSRPSSTTTNSRTSSMAPPPLPGTTSINRRASIANPTTPLRPSSMSSTSSRASVRPTLKTVSSALGRRTSAGSVPSGKSSPDGSTASVPLRRSRLGSGSEEPSSTVADPFKRTVSSGLATMRESVSPGGITGKSSSAITRENDDLKSKIRLLEKKALENREKLQAMARVEQERDKFEIIIQKLQTKFQPQQAELADLRRQIKESEAQREELEMQRTENEMIVEMATLDREMAEENYEVLKTEITALKDKLEEYEMEIEVLREENTELGKEMSPEEKTSAGWLQMERQNERLKEALLRLRDVTLQQEAELRDTIKSLEEDNNELSQFKEQYETTKEKLTQTEVAIEDLRSQLDHALGAEEMLEELTEKNLSYSEEVEELQATIEDLESLQELADELEINHVETEKQMQEELDYKDLLIAEQTKRIVQSEETALDFEYTIARFRELVITLQSDLEDKRASQQTSASTTEELSSRSRTMMDLNLKLQMSASKAQVKTIDLELRKMEASEASEHLAMVQMYLPESFNSERDSILALLRFKRVSFKAHLLQTHVKERLLSDSQSTVDEVVIAACDVCDKLTWVNAMCHRFVNCISGCSTSHFERFRGALTELEPVERTLNMWIEAVRKDELKEVQVADELSRTLALMSHLGEVHLTDNLEGYAENIHMKVLLMQSYLESTASAISYTKTVILKQLPPTDDEADMSTYFAKKADNLVANCRSAKVVVSKVFRSLEELRSRSLTLCTDTLPSFEHCEELAKKLAAYARQAGHDLHALLVDEGRAEPILFDEVQAAMYRTTEKSLLLVENDLFQSAGKELKILTSLLVELSGTASDLDMTIEFERGQSPWVVRAQQIKSKKVVHVDIEDEIRRLKDEVHSRVMQIKLRDQALEESAVRIEHLESRMVNVAKQSERIEELERNLADSTAREKDFTESLDNLTEELQNLEIEVTKWKKIANDKQVMGQIDKSGAERAVATAREVAALKSEISSLQGAVRFLREDAQRARNADVSVSNSWLFEPLVKPVRPGAAEDGLRDQSLAAEGRDMLTELMHIATTSTVFDLTSMPENRRSHRMTNQTPQYHYMKQREEYETLISWRDSIVSRSMIHEERKEERELKKPKGKPHPGVVKLRFTLPLAYENQLKGLPPKSPSIDDVEFDVDRPRDFERLVGEDGVLVV